MITDVYSSVPYVRGSSQREQAVKEIRERSTGHKHAQSRRDPLSALPQHINSTSHELDWDGSLQFGVDRQEITDEISQKHNPHTTKFGRYLNTIMFEFVFKFICAFNYVCKYICVFINKFKNSLIVMQLNTICKYNVFKQVIGIAILSLSIHRNICEMPYNWAFSIS